VGVRPGQRRDSLMFPCHGRLQSKQLKLPPALDRVDSRELLRNRSMPSGCWREQLGIQISPEPQVLIVSGVKEASGGWGAGASVSVVAPVLFSRQTLEFHASDFGESVRAEQVPNLSTTRGRFRISPPAGDTATFCH